VHTIQTESPRRKGIPATTVVLTLLCAMYALNYMVRVNVSTAAGAFKDELHLNNTDLGWIFSAFAYPYLACQIISGWISDRVGARVALTVFAVIWSAATVFMGLANSMAAMIFGRVLLGVGVSALPTATRAMSTWMAPGKRAFAQGITHSAARLGNAITPPLVAGLIAVVAWRGSFVVLGIVSLGWAIAWAWYFRDNPAEHPSMRASMQSSTRVSITPSEMDAFAKARSSRERAKEPVPFMRLARRMSLVTVVYFCYGWTLWFFLAWVPQFFLHNYRLNLNHSALFSGGVFLGGVLGDFSGGVVSDHIFEKTGDRKKARRNLIIFGFLCSLVMMLPIVLVHNLTSAAIFLSLAFFFAEFTVAPMWAIPMDIAPNFSGFASGFMNSGSALAAIISPVLAGKIIDATGNWELPFYGSMSLLLLGAILAVWMKTEEMRSEPSANAEPAVQPAV
jgi:MFS family permease